MPDVAQAPERHRFWSHDVRVRLRAILWFLAAVGFLICLPILVTAWWVIPLVVAVLAAIIALPIAWLVRRTRHGAGASFGRRWLKYSVVGLFGLTILLAAPIIYAATITQVSPAMVPQAVLTNGKRTIVFQGMQHVATEPFYKSVVYDMEEALSRGDVLYFEGVQKGTPASEAWLWGVVTGGGMDIGTLYGGLAKVCDLRSQSDYFALLDRDAQARPNQHVKADVSSLDMMREAQRLRRIDPALDAYLREKETSPPNSGTAASMENVISYLNKGTDGQRDLAGTLCRGFMTYQSMEDDGEPSPMDPIILDYRNRELAKRLLSDQHPRVVVTYGAKHLPGVYDLLKAADPRWQVASLKWSRVIDAPERLEGPALFQ